MPIRVDQIPNKNRPYWVWVWQGNLTGGGIFGAAGGWTRYDGGQPGKRVDLRQGSSVFRCLNCGPGTKIPTYEYINRLGGEFKSNTGRPPSVTAFVPAGLPGQTGPIVSFFPPITVDIDCQQSPLRINGGQIATIYDVTLSASGFIRDFETGAIIIPFNVETTLRGPGPIAGYTVSQYTFDAGARDLRANVYYTDANNQLGDFRKDFRLSLSALLGDNPNMTLEGNNYYFDVKEVILENLVRADGLDDQCGTSACNITFEVEIFTQGNPVPRYEEVTQTLQFVVSRIQIEPGLQTGNTVVAYSKGDAQSEVIFQALPSDGGPVPGDTVSTAALLDIDCTYDVNGALPGCFIESPETCNVTIRDQVGILLDQTYFGRPVITTSSEYPPIIN